MTILALLVVALFAWAVIASTAAAEWKAEADRATDFAEDALEQTASYTDLLDSYRRINGHLVAYIRDGRDEDAWLTELLASEEETPIHDSLGAESLRAELDDDDAVRRWLA